MTALRLPHSKKSERIITWPRHFELVPKIELVHAILACKIDFVLIYDATTAVLSHDFVSVVLSLLRHLLALLSSSITRYFTPRFYGALKAEVMQLRIDDSSAGLQFKGK